MAKINKKVVVIILNYNVWQAALKCVASVKRSAYPNVSVVVIDNKSPDGSAAELKRRLPKDVTFIVNDKNTGYAGGNNIGLAWALDHGADYVFILNPDTTVEPPAISRLVAFAERAERSSSIINKYPKGAGFIGPRIFHTDNPSDPTIYSDGGTIHWTLTKATLQRNGQTMSKAALRHQPFPCGYISGTAVFVSRRVLEDVGFLREDYFLYYEDTDWSLRCRTLGFGLFIVPEAVVYHVGYQSTGLLTERYIYYHTRNGLYLALWNGSLAIKALAIAASVFKLLKQPLKYILLPAKRAWIRPVSRGILDAWQGRTGPMSS